MLTKNIAFAVSISEFLKKIGFDDSNYSISIPQFAVSMIVAILVAVLIYFVYKHCFRGVIYRSSFNVTIALMVIITAMIVATISSNVTLSLGMVGALSIVRFRTAIKDPVDLMFLFWAVAAGIAIGAEIYYIVLVGNVIIALAFIIFSRLKTKKLLYLLVVTYDEKAEKAVLDLLSGSKYLLRSKLTKNGVTELTVELALKTTSPSVSEPFAKIEGVTGVSLVAYNCDFAQ
ncbi:MAG: DUF4956 domain-containing protein [Clostridia bacterium]|nr:DUF4956 domain-containing protein [Clostridia bacterium]